MDLREIRALMAEVAPIIREFVGIAVAPLADRLAAIDLRLDSLPVPHDGRDADPGVVADIVVGRISPDFADIRSELGAITPVVRTIGEAISEAMAATFVTDILPQIATAAQKAVDALPRAKGGEPGIDADPEAVAAIAAKLVVDELTETIRADVAAIHSDIKVISAGIDEKIADRVAGAVSALPAPAPGKDADPEAVAATVTEQVSALLTDRLQADVGRIREAIESELLAANETIDFKLDAAIAALPAPRDGEDGKSIDPVEVERMVADRVTSVVAALPVPENGKDADPAVIAEMIAAEVAKLPPAEPGKPADPEEVRGLIIAEVEEALQARPVPKDGHTPTEMELAPLIQTAVRASVDALPKAEDGKSVDPVEVERIIADLVERAVANLPPPDPGAPGKSIEPAEIEEMIRGEVEKAVAKLPPAEPGKSVDPEEVRALVIAEVGVAVKALPVPADGHTPTAAELVPVVETAVARAIDGLPKPKDGEDGKPVDPAEVERMVADRVATAVAALPAPENGHTPTEEELAPIVELAVARAVEVLPKGITPADVEDMISAEVMKAVTALPPPKDGESVDLAEVERMVGEAVAKLPAPERGPEGPKGKFTPPKPWSKGIHYEGAVVAHAGSTYCAARDTADEPPHEDWEVVASRGDDAPVGEVYGLYDETKTYRKFDWVTENGSRWQAKYNAPGPFPEGWAMAAKVGKPGRPGEPGRKGDPGPPGKPGPAGPVIMEWVRDGYRAVPMMSDGTLGPALDVREFFELYHGEAR